MLIFITGGAWQGKSDFAKKLAGDRKEEYLIIEDVHLLVRDALRQKVDPFETLARQLCRYSNVILTVNELGCGIVPVEAFDRKWRETTGRVCCELARRADEVYRVTCGIPTRLK